MSAKTPGARNQARRLACAGVHMGFIIFKLADKLIGYSNKCQLHLVSPKCNHDCTSRPRAELLGMGLGLSRDRAQSTGGEIQICTCQARFSALGRVAQSLQCDLPSRSCSTSPSLKESKGVCPAKALTGSKQVLRRMRSSWDEQALEESFCL